MTKCYFCGDEITKENKSKEHIILNAIGGVLASCKLICKKCNDRFGDKTDSLLAKQLSPFSVLMNVKRQRGETPPIKAVRSSNNEKILIYPGGQLENTDSKVEKQEMNGKKIYHIVARNDNEMGRICKNLKKKHPSFEVLNSGEIVENIDEKVLIEYDLGGDALESVCKTALNYYLYARGKQEHVQTFIEKLRNHDVLDLCNFCYTNKIKIGKTEDGIFHAIALKGDSQQKLLYAYIEFFDFYHVIVLLNDSYDGETFQKVYCYNLIKKGECEASFDVDLTYDTIYDILSKDLKDYGKELVSELKSTVKQIEIKNAIDKACNEIEVEYSERFHGDIPADVFAKAFAKKISKSLLRSK